LSSPLIQQKLQVVANYFQLRQSITNLSRILVFVS